jgi:uncharacterized protein involved in exopolysaccharide biosynthesis
MNTDNSRPDALFNLLEIVSTRKIQIIIAFFIVFSITIAGVILLPPVYTTSTTVYVSLPAIPKGDMPYLSDIQSGPLFISNQLAFARSRSVYEKVARDLHLYEGIALEPSFLGKLKGLVFKSSVDPLERAIDYLYTNTSVQLKKGTNILVIAANSQSAEGAADIANAIANSYADFSNNLLKSKSEVAYGFIAERLDESKKDLRVNQSKLLDFMKTRNVASLESIQSERNSIQTELAGLKLKYEQLGEGNQDAETQDERPGGSTQSYQISASDTPRIKEIKGRLQNMERELNMTLRNYTENHPKVTAIQEQIEKEKEDLVQEAGIREQEKDRGAAAQKSPQAKRASILKQIRKLEGDVVRLSQLEIDLTKLIRDAGSKEREQMQLQQQFDSAGILKVNMEREGGIRIMDPAYPPSGANNKKRIILLAVGFIAALLFSIGSAFIIEYYDDALKSAEETERTLKIAVLGSIPRITVKKKK